MKLYIKNERTIVSKSQWNILNWLRIDDDIGLFFDDNKWKMINLRQSKICKKIVRYMQYAWTTYGNLIDDHSADRSAKMVMSMTKILSKQSRIVFIIELFQFLKGFTNSLRICLWLRNQYLPYNLMHLVLLEINLLIIVLRVGKAK